MKIVMIGYYLNNITINLDCLNYLLNVKEKIILNSIAQIYHFR
jgi:hypothetical protein